MIRARSGSQKVPSDQVNHPESVGGFSEGSVMKNALVVSKLFFSERQISESLIEAR
jgi:hypothetical protein